MEDRAAEVARRYAEVARRFGAALERLAGGYERDPDARRDLLQEIHVALWRSLARYDGRCSVRTCQPERMISWRPTVRGREGRRLRFVGGRIALDGTLKSC